MRMSDWSSDVCSSDLDGAVDYEAEIGAGSGDGADGDVAVGGADPHGGRFAERADHRRAFVGILDTVVVFVLVVLVIVLRRDRQDDAADDIALDRQRRAASEQVVGRSEAQTSAPQSLMRLSYAVFWCKKKKNNK